MRLAEMEGLRDQEFYHSGAFTEALGQISSFYVGHNYSLHVIQELPLQFMFENTIRIVTVQDS